MHLDRHLDRLESSAQYYAIPIDCGAALETIQTAAESRDTAGRLRIRLTGSGDVTAAIDDIPSMVTPVWLAVASVPVRSDDRALFHKLLDRSRYDLARAALPEANDVILHNERGEITETTTANIAVQIGGEWYTPPLDSGLLPGIERARLIESGDLIERPITLNDLAGADAVAVVNSLRGWRPARLIHSRQQVPRRANRGPYDPRSWLPGIGDSLPRAEAECHCCQYGVHAAVRDVDRHVGDEQIVVPVDPAPLVDDRCAWVVTHAAGTRLALSGVQGERSRLLPTPYQARNLCPNRRRIPM